MKNDVPESDGPMECDDCGKVCQGIQGIRGHRRSCPGKSERSVDEPGFQVVEPGNGTESQQVVPDRRESYVGSRLDREATDMTIQIHEGLETMQRDIVDSLNIRRVMNCRAREMGWANYEDWYKVARDVCHLKLAVERIVTQARVSRNQPWELYKMALSIRERWILWRREEAHRAWEQQEQEVEKDFDEVLLDYGVPQLEAGWSRIIDGLRWLTSHTKATLN